MTTTRNSELTIARLLDDFFAEVAEGARPTTVRRLATVRMHLEAYLDEHAWHVLTSRQLAILRAEQQHNPVGAFARTMGAEDLFFAFSCYLRPEYRLRNVVDARCQVRVIGQLTQWLYARGLLANWRDMACIALDIECALREARRSLATAAAQP
ncbi:hypothetical protein [Glaciihabitans sp. dw_435]|uniref:hypothetical protein n=1 Tax=Glaciihabitans sp. dw_435 TaxID=2720081 RepID=UPI001BD2FEAE|nr:hypothetical protein [Glaciihabitans sp. dw_435]